MIIQLTYELKDSDRDYSNLYTHIESLGDSIHFLKDSWWIEIKDNSTKLSDLLILIKEHMGENDLFHLVDISDMQTDGWLANSSWDWLKQRSNISSK